MPLTAHTNAQAFLDAYRYHLEADEALHTMTLGTCAYLADKPNDSGYYAALHEEHALAAAFVWQTGESFLTATDISTSTLAVLADDLQSRELSVQHVFGPLEPVTQFADLVAARQQTRTRTGDPAIFHELTTMADIPLSPGYFRLARSADEPLIAEWLSAFYAESFKDKTPPDCTIKARGMIASGDFYLLEDRGGTPVSMAARTRPGKTGASVAWVYTPPEARGHGYATTVTAHLSRKLLKGRFSRLWLFTDAGNPTSNRIYAKIGYRPIMEYVGIDFVGSK